MSYRDVWCRTVAVLGVSGLLLALLESEPLTVVIALACCFGVLTLALVGLHSCDGAGTLDWSAVRWRAALGACVCVGFPAACAVSTGATLLVALVAALSSPPAVARVRRVAGWSTVPAGTMPQKPRPAPASLAAAAPAEQVTRMLESGPTPGLIASMDDATLCVAWQRSFQMLSAASTVSERALVAHLRQLYLDELDRRHPTSFASWLRTLPAASSGPDRFLPGV